METAAQATADPREVVPFLGVADMEQSLRFYVDGLGFAVGPRWVDRGRLRWCRISRSGVSLMLQEFLREGSEVRRPEGTPGLGVSLVFMCADAVALYREVSARGALASEPQVLNALWTTHLSDPDGYHLYFESPTDVPELTKLSGASQACD